MDQNHTLVNFPSADWDLFSLWARHMASQMISRLAVRVIKRQVENGLKCLLEKDLNGTET